MAEEARPSERSSGQVLMGSAIGVVAAIAFAVFLWMAVH
jgi:hypothetical protein